MSTRIFRHDGGSGGAGRHPRLSPQHHAIPLPPGAGGGAVPCASGSGSGGGGVGSGRVIRQQHQDGVSLMPLAGPRHVDALAPPHPAAPDASSLPSPVRVVRDAPHHRGPRLDPPQPPLTPPDTAVHHHAHPPPPPPSQLGFESPSAVIRRQAGHIVDMHMRGGGAGVATPSAVSTPSTLALPASGGGGVARGGGGGGAALPSLLPPARQASDAANAVMSEQHHQQQHQSLLFEENEALRAQLRESEALRAAAGGGAVRGFRRADTRDLEAGLRAGRREMELQMQADAAAHERDLERLRAERERGAREAAEVQLRVEREARAEGQQRAQRQQEEAEQEMMRQQLSEINARQAEGERVRVREGVASPRHRQQQQQQQHHALDTQRWERDREQIAGTSIAQGARLPSPPRVCVSGDAGGVVSPRSGGGGGGGGGGDGLLQGQEGLLVQQLLQQQHQIQQQLLQQRQEFQQQKQQEQRQWQPARPASPPLPPSPPRPAGGGGGGVGDPQPTALPPHPRADPISLTIHNNSSTGASPAPQEAAHHRPPAPAPPPPPLPPPAAAATTANPQTAVPPAPAADSAAVQEADRLRERLRDVQSECDRSVSALAERAELLQRENDALTQQAAKLSREKSAAVSEALEAKKRLHQATVDARNRDKAPEESAAHAASAEKLMEGIVTRDNALQERDQYIDELEARYAALKEAHCRKVFLLEDKVKILSEKNVTSLQSQMLGCRGQLAESQEKLAQKSKELSDHLVQLRAAQQGLEHERGEGRRTLHSNLRAAENRAAALERENKRLALELASSADERRTLQDAVTSLDKRLAVEAGTASRLKKQALLEGSVDTFSTVSPRASAVFSTLAQGGPILQRDAARGGGLGLYAIPPLLREALFRDLWDSSREGMLAEDAFLQWSERFYRRSAGGFIAFLEFFETGRAEMHPDTLRRGAGLFSKFSGGSPAFSRGDMLHSLQLSPHLSSFIFADLQGRGEEEEYDRFISLSSPEGVALRRSATPSMQAGGDFEGGGGGAAEHHSGAQQQITEGDWLAYLEKVHQKTPSALEPLLRLLSDLCLADDAAAGVFAGATGVSMRAERDSSEKARLEATIASQNAAIVSLQLDLDEAKAWGPQGGRGGGGGGGQRNPQHHHHRNSSTTPPGMQQPLRRILSADLEERALSLYVSATSLLQGGGSPQRQRPQQQQKGDDGGSRLADDPTRHGGSSVSPRRGGGGGGGGGVGGAAGGGSGPPVTEFVTLVLGEQDDLLCRALFSELLSGCAEGGGGGGGGSPPGGVSVDAPVTPPRMRHGAMTLQRFLRWCEHVQDALPSGEAGLADLLEWLDGRCVRQASLPAVRARAGVVFGGPDMPLDVFASRFLTYPVMEAALGLHPDGSTIAIQKFLQWVERQECPLSVVSALAA